MLYVSALLNQHNHECCKPLVRIKAVGNRSKMEKIFQHMVIVALKREMGCIGNGYGRGLTISFELLYFVFLMTAIL